MEDILRHRGNILSGIINGVDYNIWNPTTDPHIAANYGSDNWSEHKPACKADLQRRLGLPEKADVPLLAIIGRLADQKGLDLLAGIIPKWVVNEDVQWAILGTGEPTYHELFQSLSDEYPSKVAARLEFSDEWAHRIEAGADMFLMPSRYEPCGLNQLYSLKYGTVPVVHKTGGLADTIQHASATNLQAGRANGFSFDSYDARELEQTLYSAVQMYRDDPRMFKQLVTTGMKQDWSWAESARKYVQLYETTIARANATVCA
jgi:starch synthase